MWPSYWQHPGDKGCVFPPTLTVHTDTILHPAPAAVAGGNAGDGPCGQGVGVGNLPCCRAYFVMFHSPAFDVSWLFCMMLQKVFFEVAVHSILFCKKNNVANIDLRWQ
jgi:hypothetical protein